MKLDLRKDSYLISISSNCNSYNKWVSVSYFWFLEYYQKTLLVIYFSLKPYISWYSLLKLDFKILKKTSNIFSFQNDDILIIYYDNFFQKWRDVSYTGAAQNGDRPRPFLALLCRKCPHIRGTSWLPKGR